jgi:hypothetical protein
MPTNKMPTNKMPRSVKRSPILRFINDISPHTIAANKEKYFQSELKEWESKNRSFRGNVITYNYIRPTTINYKVVAVTKKAVDYAIRHPLRVLDNGGRPFLVDLQNDHVDIYMRRDPKPTREGSSEYGFPLERNEEYREYDNCVLVLSLKMNANDTVFLGESDYFNFKEFQPNFVGCSVLIQRQIRSSFEVTLIASSIERSIINEPVRTFIASVGNSGVPYGYATTDNFLINFQPIACHKSATYSLQKTMALTDDQKACMPNSGFNRRDEAKKQKEFGHKNLKVSVLMKRLYG